MSNPLKKILLLGNGGREHAIAKALKRSKKYQVEIYGFFSANNPAIAQLCEKIYIEPSKNFGEESGFKSLKSFALCSNLDFAVLGPDDPIGAGAADALLEVGIKSFGPSKKAAQLESSKGFTRSLLEKYDIQGNPGFKRFSSKNDSIESLTKYISSLEYKFVIKDDGLCGGKGVFVQDDHFNNTEEGIDIAKNIFKKSGELVIEEKLEGPEFSLMSIADGKTIVPTPTIADHKRAFNGDTGPNTGGMGTISFNGPLPFITDKNIEEALDITKKVMEAVENETGDRFCGVMYGGFMRTKNGVKLIEYNARFGDPEALNALPLLESDAVDLFQAAIDQKLDQIKVSFAKKSTVCKYLVPDGYPTNSVKGKEIIIDESKIPEGVEVFYASIYEKEDKLLLGGSRSIGIVGIDKDFDIAAEKANNALEAITGPIWTREDIGSRALLQTRLDMVKDFD